tara:strand:+ start:98 stop:253 length:156 start_codon:yes stop_codon:yes gene_type:complete
MRIPSKKERKAKRIANLKKKGLSDADAKKKEEKDRKKAFLRRLIPSRPVFI